MYASASPSGPLTSLQKTEHLGGVLILTKRKNTNYMAFISLNQHTRDAEGEEPPPARLMIPPLISAMLHPREPSSPLPSSGPLPITSTSLLYC